jgi:hypothetical protein
MRTLARASISLLTAGTLSACSHGAQNEVSTRPSTQVAATTTIPPGPVRDCATSAVGALGTMSINRAGPIGFVDQWARLQMPIERRGTRIRPTKILVVVDAGRTATVAVRAGEADRVRLFYRQPSPASADGFYPMSAGDRTTTFTGCGRPTSSGTPTTPTQFPGFFLAKEPGCYHLDISEPGSPQTWRANVSLGRAC